MTAIAAGKFLGSRTPALPLVTWISIGIVAVVVIVSMMGSFLQTHDPNMFGSDMNVPPNREHWLGTDDQGQDVYSRLIAGTRLSLFYGASAACIALLIGGVAALIAMACGPVVETMVFGLIDLVRALPGILFALAFVVAFEASATSVVLALGISFAPNFAIITRATYRQQMARPYTSAAKVLGAGRMRIALVHVLPNIGGALITQFAIILPRCIVTESVLSFLGLGVSPETPTWGRMIASASSFTEDAPHAIIAPILSLAIVTFALAVIGDSLRGRFDRTRQRISQ